MTLEEEIHVFSHRLKREIDMFLDVYSGQKSVQEVVIISLSSFANCVLHFMSNLTVMVENVGDGTEYERMEMLLADFKMALDVGFKQIIELDHLKILKEHMNGK